jgi:hypothetical protein
MTGSSSFCLFTSISPRLGADELDYQKACIASWRSAGFDVVTINGQSEVARVEAFGLDVEIVTVEEGGKPPISDILACARARQLQYAGIINADCAILPYPDLARQLTAHVQGGIVVSERLDIDERLLPQPDTCSGFDAFFFDMTFIPSGFDLNFRIGVPWWDYCFPMAAVALGAKIINIETPLLTHKVHSHTWSDEERESVGQVFWRFLRGWQSLKHEDFPSFGSEVEALWTEDTLTSDQLAIVGLACFRWLQSRRMESPRRFLPEELQPIEALLHSQRMALNKLNQQAGGLREEIDIQRGANAVLELGLKNLQEYIEDLQKSTSWRVTKPLREVGGWFASPALEQKPSEE